MSNEAFIGIGNRSLDDLDFSDVYLRLDTWEEPHYRPRRVESRRPGNVPVPVEYMESVDKLTDHVRANLIGDNDSMDFHGMRFRVSRQRMVDGSDWVALRRVAAEVPHLDTLGLDERLLPILRGFGGRTGLVLISGATGHGKTTTAFSILEDILLNYGHLAYTIEDPVEYNLQGRRGNNGYCFQVEVNEDDEWYGAIKKSLRWQPRYIFVGEIRAPKAAVQLLRAAASGHLVLTTVHAGSIEEAMLALMQMAELALGGRAQQLLADSLAACIHQTIVNGRLQAKTLFTEQDNVGDPVRALIRTNKIMLLGTLIEQQAARLGMSLPRNNDHRNGERKS